MVTAKDFCDMIGNKMASEYGKSMIRNNFPPNIAEQLCDAIDRKDNADMFNRIMKEYNAFQYAAICSPESYPCFNSEIIKQWEYEFHNYESGANNIRHYLGQEIEKTAREFGKLIGGA